MSDMSKPEYLTTDWIEDLRFQAAGLRREVFVKTALADQLDSLRAEFDKRIRDHEKWAEKASVQEPQP